MLNMHRIVSDHVWIQIIENNHVEMTNKITQISTVRTVFIEALIAVERELCEDFEKIYAQLTSLITRGNYLEINIAA